MTFLYILFILTAWVIAYGVFIGAGLVVTRVAGLQNGSPSLCFWLGWASVIVLLQAAHFVRPVDGLAQAAVAGIGLAGLIGGRRRLRAMRWGSSPQYVLAALVVFAVAVFAARHSLVPPRDYDTGTYHLPVVVWLNAFPLVKGLGILHVRLAFNNSAFLYNALMNTGWLSGFTINLSLGLLVVATVGELAWNGLTETGWRHAPSVAAASLVALPLLLAQIYSVSFEGLSPDLALFCCEIEVGVLIVRRFSMPEGRPWSTEWLAFVVLAAVACTLKLSALGFASGAVAWLLVTDAHAASRTKVTAVGIASVALGTWVVRNIVLSGYPLFPSPAVPLPVAWRVPLETTRQLLGWIRAWARLVDDDSMRVPFEQILSESAWLRPWLRHAAASTWEIVAPLALCALALAALVALPDLRRRVTRHQAAALLVPLAALVFWFLTAPDLRFAGASWLLLAMIACGILAEAARGTPVARLSTVAICTLALLIGGKQAINGWKWWRTWPSAIAFGSLPSPPTRSFRTASGIELQVPVVGEACWAAPLPCTPYPSASLDFNRPDDLSSGFRVVPFRDDAIVGWWTASQPWQSLKP